MNTTPTIDAAEPLASSAPDGRAAALSLCRSLRTTAEALMDVIDQETAMLREGRPHAVQDLQSDKIELSAQYLNDMTRLKRHADDVRTLVPEEVETLKPVMQTLGARLVENRNALSDVLSVSERLIRTATMTAIAAQQGPTTYGSNGVVAQPGPRATAAISVNRAL